MSGAEILIRRGSGPWETPDVLGYADEAALRDLIAKHPDLLPTVDGPAVTVTEFQTDVGPADVVVVTEAGDLVLVECKLAQNRDVRRTVVGQVLDYASRMWAMDVADFERRWAALAGESPFDALGDDGGQLRRGIGDRLRDGRFTMVLAVDGINADLRRIIEFLNHSTSADLTVVAFELARVARGDVEVLMPRTYGAELASARTRPASTVARPSWTAEEYLAWCAEHDPSSEPIMRAIIEAWPGMGWEVVNGTASTPNVIGVCDIDNTHGWPVSLFSGPDGAFIEVRLTQLDRAMPERANAILDVLSSIPDVPVDADDVRARGFRRRPKIRPGCVSGERELARLLDAFRLFTADRGELRTATGPTSARPAGP